MMQECAAKWRGMDEVGKGPYQALADKDKERWLAEKAAEKKPKDQWRPKRPPSAYFLFLKDFRAEWKIEHDIPEITEDPEALNDAKIAERLSGSGTPDSVIDNTGTLVGAGGGAAGGPVNGDAGPEVNSNTTAIPGTDSLRIPDEENNLKIDESNHEPEKPLNPLINSITHPTIPTPHVNPMIPTLPGGKKVKKERKTSRVVVS